MPQESSILDQTIKKDDGTIIVFFTGGGRCVAVEMNQEELEVVQKMRKDDRLGFIKKTLEEGWAQSKGYFGYCRFKKCETTVLDCVRCGPKERGFTTKLAWETCARQYVL